MLLCTLQNGDRLMLHTRERQQLAWYGRCVRKSAQTRQLSCRRSADRSCCRSRVRSWCFRGRSVSVTAKWSVVRTVPVPSQNGRLVHAEKALVE